MMDVILFVLKWAGWAIAGFAALLVLLTLVVAAFEAIRARRSVRARPAPTADDAGWALSLLVEVDHGLNLIRPGVQLRGDPIGDRAAIRISIVDTAGRTRLQFGRDVPADAVGTELALPAFSPPPGLGTEELLGWTWRITLHRAGRQVARWVERPRRTGALSAEGEILEEV